MPMRRRICEDGMRAFTLVELTIVLVVIGVVFAIATPRFSNASSNRRADLAMDRIERDIRLAEQDAWHTGTSRELVFDVSNNRYEIVGMTDQAGNPYIVDLSAAPYYLSLVSADFDGQQKVVFDGRGESAARGTIVLSDGAVSLTASVESADEAPLAMAVSAKVKDLSATTSATASALTSSTSTTSTTSTSTTSSTTSALTSPLLTSTSTFSTAWTTGTTGTTGRKEK